MTVNEMLDREYEKLAEANHRIDRASTYLNQNRMRVEAILYALVGPWSTSRAA